MKNLLLICVFFILSFQQILAAENNPVADPKAIVRSGDMRFTILTPEMIRIEWSDKQIFEDRASFTVINRRLPVPEYKTWEDEEFLYIKTEKLLLQYRLNSFPGTFNPASSKNLKITFEVDGQTVVWYPWKKDPLNLKGTMRTLDGADGENKRAEMEDGLLSRSGWYVIDETAERADGGISLMLDKREDGVDWVSQRQDPPAMDWYFMGYGHNYKKALYDFTRIAGKIPMPPMYAFGYWYSKYEDYSADDYKNLTLEMEENGLPQDVMVIDMDWHYSGSELDGGKGGWTGWSWNTRLIPDPKGLLNWLHEKKLKATLNLHPAYGIAPYEDNYQALYNDLQSRGMDLTADSIINEDGTIRWNLENEDFYKAFFKNIIRPHENIGVDFWWLDWQQWLLAENEEKLSNTFWCNHVFYNDMKAKGQARPIIFHRWGGLGSHRYQIGFSGDSHTSFETLKFETYFTSTASNVGYGYWSHDIGGHHQNGENNPELFLRWIQFGVFSPIIRTHSSNNPDVERRMWKYPNYPLMREAVKLRYAMVPYIYTQARVSYDTGISLCRPLYYEWPENNEAYKHDDEYMFGNDILAAPIVKAADADGTISKTIWLPEGKWYEVCSGEILEGNQSYTRTFTQSDIPHYIKEGAIIPYFPELMDLKSRPDKLILKFIPGSKGELRYYEDENDNDNYENGAFTFTPITQEKNGNEGIYTIHPIEGYFNGMLNERSYDIELLAVNKPENVVVNGLTYTYANDEKPGTWKYDSAKRTAIIYLPKIACDQETKIVVTHGMSSINDIKESKQAVISYSSDSRQMQVSLDKNCNNIHVSLFDVMGKNLLSDHFKDARNILLDLSTIPSDGLCIVQLTYDNHIQTQKIIL